VGVFGQMQQHVHLLRTNSGQPILDLGEPIMSFKFIIVVLLYLGLGGLAVSKFVDTTMPLIEKRAHAARNI
jgi:hypothetical protein